MKLSCKAIQFDVPEDWMDTVPLISKIVVSLGRQLLGGFTLGSRKIVATLSRQLLDGFGLLYRKIVVTSSRELPHQIKQAIREIVVSLIRLLSWTLESREEAGQ